MEIIFSLLCHTALIASLIMGLIISQKAEA
jgi:hypothetical protein